MRQVARTSNSTKSVPLFSLGVHMVDFGGAGLQELGQVGFPDFSEIFSAFPWSEQLKALHKIGGDPPTLEVTDLQSEVALSLSVVGTEQEYGFVVVLVQRRKRYFPFFRTKFRLTTNVFLVEQGNTSSILALYKHFFERNKSAFDEQLKKFPKWKALELGLKWS